MKRRSKSGMRATGIAVPAAIAGDPEIVRAQTVGCPEAETP